MRGILILLCALVTICTADDGSLARGVPGTYRRSDGMNDEALTLRSDSTYTFECQFDVGRSVETGVWRVRDSIITLEAKANSEVIKSMPAHFLVVVVDGDLALRVQDAAIQSDDEQEPMLLYRRDKQEANQSLEPTTLLVTIRACARLAPSRVVAHL